MKATVKITKVTASVSFPINNNGCYINYKINLKTDTESLENNFGMDSKDVNTIFSICRNFKKLHCDSELKFIYKMSELFNSKNTFAEGMYAIKTYN